VKTFKIIKAINSWQPYLNLLADAVVVVVVVVVVAVVVVVIVVVVVVVGWGTSGAYPSLSAFLVERAVAHAAGASVDVVDANRDGAPLRHRDASLDRTREALVRLEPLVRLLDLCHDALAVLAGQPARRFATTASSGAPCLCFWRA
jgi:hypothetical protein